MCRLPSYIAKALYWYVHTYTSVTKVISIRVYTNNNCNLLINVISTLDITIVYTLLTAF